MMKNIKLIAVVTCQLIITSVSYAQVLKDTIYYDKFWRICEAPIANYFRLGELHTIPKWRFINGVKDYYKSGQLEMSGHYLQSGNKDGFFTFYYPDGKLKKAGSFVNDTMKGTWSFYNEAGSLYFQMDCENNFLFTPLLITNQRGDTLIKNGEGKFALKLQDFPDVFPDAMDYLIKGYCSKNKRSGEWEYDYFNFNEWHLIVKELYVDGVFTSGQQFPLFGETKAETQPAFITDISLSKLAVTEGLVYDRVFNESQSTSYSTQLVSFLVHGEVPAFTAKAKSFSANILDYLPLCAASVSFGALNSPKINWYEVTRRMSTRDRDCWLLGYCLETDNKNITTQAEFKTLEKLPFYNARISFTINESGYASDIVAKGNLGMDVLSHMVYYLSRLSHLVPKRENGMIVPAHQDLYLFTKVDSVTNQGYNYIIYRLLLSTKPKEQANDKFKFSDFEIVENENEVQFLLKQ